MGLSFDGVPLETSEDCLSVNVFTPTKALRDRNSKLPVMLWFQGGAFVQLFNPRYNGTGLIAAADEDAIIVTFNYRVGPYGFLASEELAKEGSLNVGLHDQRKAIEWTHKYISKFGGDPDQINLFGTSVGGGSILLHTLQTDENDKFWKNGIAAAPYIPTSYSVSELKPQYDDFLSKANCTDLQCLRAFPIDDIQKANYRTALNGTEEYFRPLFPYGLTIDNDLIKDLPLNSLDKGDFSRRHNLIIGTSNSEGTLFSRRLNTTSEVNRFIKAQFPLLVDGDLAKAQELYADVPRTEPGVEVKLTPQFLRTAKIYGDILFSGPAVQFAKALSRVGSEVYFFRDNIRDAVEVSIGMLVPHTWEVQAIWGPEYAHQYVANATADSYNGTNPNSRIVPIVQGLWTDFARFGKFRKSSVKWDSYNESGKRLRLQTNCTALEGFPARDVERWDFWKSISNRTRI